MKKFEYVTLNDQRGEVEADNWERADGWLTFYRFEGGGKELPYSVPVKVVVKAIQAGALFSVGEVPANGKSE